MMMKVLYLVTVAVLMSLAEGAAVVEETNLLGQEQIVDSEEPIVAENIQNGEELELLDEIRDQEHVDSDPICGLITPLDGEVDDDFKYHLNVTVNEKCNNPNDNNEVFGECWCPDEMSCRSEGTLEDHMTYFCILTATLVLQDELREDFGDGLLLGGGGSPEIVVSVLDDENSVVDSVNVAT